MENTGKSERFLREVGAARYLEVSVATLRRWRLMKKGPQFLKLEGSVRYLPEDLEAFIENSRLPA